MYSGKGRKRKSSERIEVQSSVWLPEASRFGSLLQANCICHFRSRCALAADPVAALYPDASGKARLLLPSFNFSIAFSFLLLRSIKKSVSTHTICAHSLLLLLLLSHLKLLTMFFACQPHVFCKLIIREIRTHHYR